jgi:hypothetical protein
VNWKLAAGVSAAASTGASSAEATPARLKTQVVASKILRMNDPFKSVNNFLL